MSHACIRGNFRNIPHNAMQFGGGGEGDLWIRGNPKFAVVILPETLFVKANLLHLLEYGRK